MPDDLNSAKQRPVKYKDKPFAPQADLNRTAFKILRLAQWLQHENLSLATMQQRLLNDPLATCANVPSNDTMWMYLNTLRQLGCTIESVKQKDDHKKYYKNNDKQVVTSTANDRLEKCFTLVKHPFYVRLSSEEIASLLRIRQEAEQCLPLDELLNLNSFLHCLVSHAKTDTSQSQASQQLLVRWINYDNYSEFIKTIKSAIACNGKQLLLVTYCNNKHHLSPLTLPTQRLQHQDCQQSFQAWFLPIRLLYRSGTLYVSGFLAGYKALSFLRIEQLLDLVPWSLNNDNDTSIPAPLASSVIDDLCHRPYQLMQAKVKVWFCNVAEWNRLSQQIGLVDPHDLAQDETVTVFFDNGMDGIAITNVSHDFFSLKQRLLALGKPFKIETPAFFATDVAQELQAMLANYQTLGSS
jgi:hypothetical protein